MAQLGQLDGARKAFDAALNLPPAQARTHVMYASTLIKLGEAEPALAQLQGAVELGFGNSHIEQGRELLQAGNNDAALAALEQALSLDEQAG